MCVCVYMRERQKEIDKDRDMETECLSQKKGERVDTGIKHFQKFAGGTWLEKTVKMLLLDL